MPPETKTPLPALAAPSAAPFLVWPVSQREFYRTICLALIPSFAWGLVIFGNRTLVMLLMAIAGTSFTYMLLKHWLAWKPGRPLMYMHCLLSALVLVALAHPTWPIWVITAFALLLPAVLAALGGPGRERIHVAVALVLAIQYMLLPAIAPYTYAGKADAILARDRLFMGDIRNQSDQATAVVMSTWPTSRDLGGDDAAVFPPPAQNAANALNQISYMLPSLDEPIVPRHSRNVPPVTAPAAGTTRAAGTLRATPATTATGPSTAGSAMGTSRPGTESSTAPSLPEPPPPETGPLSRTLATQMSDDVLDPTFVRRLPGIESFLWGVAPNRIGAASLVALIFAGLYLSYRYILRPRSVLFFLVAYILATALFVFTPNTYLRVGPVLIWEVFKQFPGQLLALFFYLLLNSDAAFAGVIILALPGTEPLTPRARRIFLTLAAVGAAGLHRLDPTTPAATLCLCLLMPAAPLFDRVLAQRSWLNRR